MKRILAGSFLAGLTFFTTPLPAQDVSADVAVRSGPVAGRVTVANRQPEYGYRRVIIDRRVPARRVFIERQGPRLVIVERFPRGHRKHWRHWQRGYHVVTVYYARGRYYDRFDSRYAGLREVVVYERDGRFYRDE